MCGRNWMSGCHSTHSTRRSRLAKVSTSGLGTLPPPEARSGDLPLPPPPSPPLLLADADTGADAALRGVTAARVVVAVVTTCAAGRLVSEEAASDDRVLAPDIRVLTPPTLGRGEVQGRPRLFALVVAVVSVVPPSDVAGRAVASPPIISPQPSPPPLLRTADAGTTQQLMPSLTRRMKADAPLPPPPLLP
jgi:hypothetical protein